MRRHVNVVLGQSLDLLLVYACQLLGGTTPPAHLVMLLPITVQPLVQLRAVGIDLVDEGVPKPPELSELPFQVIVLGSKVVSVITNNELCHRDTFFSSSRARSIKQAPMAAE